MMAFNSSQTAYVALRNIIAERTSKIVAWVGSGLSVPANLPTWAGLKDVLLQEFENQIEIGESEEKERLIKIHRQITETSNYWIAFKRLREQLGHTTYRSTIREKFRTADSVTIPEHYKKIWALKISGVINLNIDRFATRAYTESTRKSLIEFNAKSMKDYLHVLQSPSPYIINLHGRHDDVSSWVFTENDLNWLMNDIAYQTFLKSCIASNVTVFFGISADDKAVGGHFERLSELKIDAGDHFWITHRNDGETRRWAEKAGIRLIIYNKTDEGGHQELDEIFEDLTNYLPVEGTALPIISDFKSEKDEESMPPIEKLLTYDSEKIRQVLNAEAVRILSNGSEFGGDDYTAYEEFCTQYDEAIYRAWYTSTIKSKNKLFANVLQEEVKKGAFGRVYSALDAKGKPIAVKVLLEEVRNYPESIQCFRRGVRSMRILAKNNIAGMVGYKEASEIPACVVMDWVEGPNLSEAVKSNQIETWDDILKISSSLAKIIYKAHRLPERVLHRDLRPSNIMLKDFYITPNEWEVMLLDFDLSWHRGSTEKSVNHGSYEMGSGYLAPEQIKKYKKISTRHAAVDSFGMGMVLFFLLLQESPIPFEHKHEDYEKKVFARAVRKKCSHWQSVPKRFAGLILNCTKQKQSERWDMGQIHDELNRLYLAILNPESVRSTELITEELVARTAYVDRYCWNQDNMSAHIALPNGLNLNFLANESNQTISLNIVWDGSAQYEIKRIKKWLPDAVEKSAKVLEKASWLKIKKSKMDANTIVTLNAVAETNTVRKDIDSFAKSIDTLCNHLSLK